MAEYSSRYEELTFYVGEKSCKFFQGRYVTEDAKEIEALNGLADAERVDAAEAATEEVSLEAPAKRKASAK